MPSRVTMPRRKAKAMRVSAILIQEDLSSPFEKVLKDSCTGIEFPLLNDFSGVMQRCVGLGQKKRSFFFAGLFASDEYSIAMYVCPELCAKELSSRERGGMDLKDVDPLCDALMDGAFPKAMHMVFAREITGEQFVEPITKALAERMQLMGLMGELEEFASMFQDRTFVRGNDVMLSFQKNGELEVAVHGSVDSSSVKSFNSSALSRGILEVFLGANTLSPTIRIAAGQGAMKLLDSDKVRREYLHRSILTEQDYKNPQYYKNKDKKKPE